MYVVYDTWIRTLFTTTFFKEFCESQEGMNKYRYKGITLTLFSIYTDTWRSFLKAYSIAIIIDGSRYFHDTVT